MPTRSMTVSWYRSTSSPSSTKSPVSVSYQPGFGSSSHFTRPVVQASSSTPAADNSLSTSISKRVRDEPYGPSSAPPTMTTRSAGSTSTSPHSGTGTDASVRGGDGSAETVPSCSSVSVEPLSASISSRASAARAAMSISTSPSPPVKSTLIGSPAATALASTVHRPSSMAAISSVVYVVTPAASTAPTMASLWPISPVPLVQPIRACASETRAAQDDSALHRATTASSADLASP